MSTYKARNQTLYRDISMAQQSAKYINIHSRFITQ